ncbi:hypothetical protein N7457_008754 [Penicillium paradoxum]|uniref:uncharacterized protein n=1 Tax=Penicillium paradoxum TaxID=176176 RepID=UPI0025492B73|nr:uncharacterized protein N7457_008754 [Penicillium paradoxum]KAJ5773858.1 hypothetical protein N7457_008754 [Penicillium paradoxum]
MGLSSALLVAIVVILAQYNHQPQPTWRFVSLNTIISWLSTIAKGCVLFTVSEGIGQLKWVWFTRKSRPLGDLGTFDGASRGIYGCAGLVWRLRAKHFASLGSLAVILAIAFDPFVQSLINYYSGLIVDPSGTAILSSNSVYNVLGPPLSRGTYYVDPAMKANIYNSLYSTDSSDPWSIPRYTCSSGNCTWDPITTLEMRATCTNITDRLQMKTQNSTVKYVPSITEERLSVYLQKDKWSNVSADVTTDSLRGTPVVLGTWLTPFVYENNIGIPVVQIIGPDELPASGMYGAKFNHTVWQAVECTIIPIVHSFRAKVVEGVYHEETLATWTNGSFPDNVIETRNYTLQPPWGPEMGIEPGKNYKIGKRQLDSLSVFFRDFFSGKAELDSIGFRFSTTGKDVLEVITLSNVTNCSVRTVEKLPCIMDNVAKAMSKAIRDTASSSDLATTRGQAMVNATFVSIHWQWIALPALVWLLGLITLLGTMWKTRRDMVPAWKNDLMPILSLYGGVQNEKLLGTPVVRETERVKLFENEGKMVLSG